MDFSNFQIRPLNRSEFDMAVEWAAAEGWNPGLSDADVFWQTDPEGFVGIEENGELVGTGSIVSYDGELGFMGFFIVKPGLRGKGIGSHLWHFRRDTLKNRIKEGAAIGMDGVFDMQDWYARGGFEFSHRNLRMEGVGQLSSGPIHPDIIPLTEVPFELVAALDQECFGCKRESFLRSWIDLPDSPAFGFVSDSKLKGFGVIRPCREGFKIGPLFAEDDATAEALFTAMSNEAPGAPIWLDIPENNPGAVRLASDHDMIEVFGCARMYLGPKPSLPWQKIYGITTFELG